MIIIAARVSGTTVTFVIIDGWVVTAASVGDSRCILESAEGSVYFLSADHRLEVNEEEYVSCYLILLHSLFSPYKYCMLNRVHSFKRSVLS